MPDTHLLEFREQIQMGPARRGTVLVVAGRVLLWMDLLLLSFVYMSVRDGSDFWLWWVLAEALLGGTLVLFGSWYRSRAVS